MTLFKRLMGAVLVAMPVLLIAVPSEAATARQYQAQGHGHYVSSTGRGHHRVMHHRRHR